MTRIASALLALSFALACGDDDDCAIDFDAGDLDAKVCEGVAEIVDCIEEKHGVRASEIDDADVEPFVDECYRELVEDWCSMDPRTVDLARYKATDEIAGESNDCVGGG